MFLDRKLRGMPKIFIIFDEPEQLDYRTSSKASKELASFHSEL